MASRNFDVDESIDSMITFLHRGSILTFVSPDGRVETYDDTQQAKLTLHRKAMRAKKYWSSIWEIPGSFLCFSKLYFAGSSAIVFKVMYYLIYDPPVRRTISSEDFEIC